jgi:hypothetical protein
MKQIFTKEQPVCSPLLKKQMQAAQASAVQKFGRREKKWFSKHFL